MQTKSKRKERKKRSRRTPTARPRPVRVEITSSPVAPPEWVRDVADDWYVARVHTRREERAERDLWTDNVDAWLPKVTVTTTARGRKVQSVRALFPGYLLIAIQAGSLAGMLRRIGQVEAVIELVGAVDAQGEIRRASRLPRRFVEMLIERMSEVGPAAEVAPRAIASGDEVRLIEGPFASFLGVVERVMPELGRLVVQANIFGRSTGIELELAQDERA